MSLDMIGAIVVAVVYVLGFLINEKIHCKDPDETDMVMLVLWPLTNFVMLCFWIHDKHKGKKEKGL